MDASGTDWIRFFSIVLAAVNIGALAGLAKAYFRATRAGDQALLRPARTLTVLAIGLLIVFVSISWRNVQLIGSPLPAALWVLPVGYLFTIYGFLRLRMGVRERIEEYGKKGKHHSNSA